MSSSRKRKAEDDLSPQRARTNPSLNLEEGGQAEVVEEQLDGQYQHPLLGMGESAKEVTGSAEDYEKDEDEDNEDNEDEDGGSSSLPEDYIDESEDEGDGYYETEIEKDTLQLKDGQSVKSKVFRLESDEFPQEWMQTIIANCTLETQTGNEDREGAKEVGHTICRYIDRSRITSTFWVDMDEPSEDLSNLAFSIFDRYGRLRHEFKEHIIRKGTGVWGSELDTGNLFVVEDMVVDRAWRRHGLGRAMLQTILRKAKSSRRDPSFILVRPGFLTRDIRQDVIGKTRREEYDIQGQVVDGVTAFYQANGFRRIGASSWLGCMSNLFFI
jgi:GNAT superfamily N-acetyltransferase